MDVRIGLAQSNQIVEIDLEDTIDRTALKAEIDAAVAAGQATVWFTDRKGKEVGVATDRIAFIEIGTPEADRRIGFGA